MPAPTKRSAKERALYPHDNTMSRKTDNTKVLHLEPPESIKHIPDKLNMWNYLCTDLASRELLSPSYMIPLTMLVDNIFDYHEYKVMLDGSGPLVPIMAKDGESVVKYVANPLFMMVKQIESRIHKLCEKFGLTPRDAIYTTNPDIKEKQVLEAQKVPDRKAITYFQ